MSDKPASLDIIPVAGVRWGTAYAGIKSSASSSAVDDLALMEFAPGSHVAGVFTQNAFSAAPVKLAQGRLRDRLGESLNQSLYLLINSGNANAGTGAAGFAAAEQSCGAIAASIDCNADQVLPFSTGVIGQLLPVELIASATSALWGSMDDSAAAWLRAARAIMTTDTVPKAFSRTVEIDNTVLTLSGICKGAGMIKPNMATMLAYVACDAAIDQNHLAVLLKSAVEQSFNRITVDGDTSTNDACMLGATGFAGVTVSPEHPQWLDFQSALNGLFVDLCTAIIRDAEGATKFITLEVNGGKDSDECLNVAYSVAESPLVKTAFFASDANWGRILAAIGRSGLQDLAVDQIEIYLDNLLICCDGGAAPDYSEPAAMKIMSQSDITVVINLHRGDAQERVWTSDLSLDYVRINADYRT